MPEKCAGTVTVQGSSPHVPNMQWPKRSSRTSKSMGRPIFAVVLALVGAGGAQCLPPPDAERTAGLAKFESAEQMRTYLADQANGRLGQNRWRGGLFAGFSFASPPMMDSAEAPASQEGDDGSQFSTTNIQEVGVDESDVVKNNGTHIFWLKGRMIHVVSATPPEAMVEVATIALDAPGDALYLRGRQLIALSYGFDGGNWQEADRADGDAPVSSSPGSPDPSDPVATVVAPASPPFIGGPWFDGGRVTVTFVDVSDPASPVIEAAVDIEGSLVTSRLIDNRLHLVLTTIPRLPFNATPAAVRAMTLDDWLPDFAISTEVGQVRSGKLIAWQNAYRPIYEDGFGITTVVTLDADDPTGELSSTALTADAGTIYASRQAIYICDPKYDWTLGLGRADTIVHKLNFTPEGTAYAASGLVPGRPLSQYSLGEHEGYLRIATTQETFTWLTEASTNGVYVLEEVDGELAIVGRVEDLGIDETIYAARFLGDRGFLVTFRRVDPLYTLDLSDPTDPRVLGELKIPGYSDHIQLIGEDHLLTIGKDAEEAGDWGAWILGVQLSIFDVTDMSDPVLLHKEVIGTRGTHSEANNNPKAFNYFAPADALAFPIELYEGDPGGPTFGQWEFTGLMVYRVTVEDGFTELGRISTTPPDDAAASGCGWWHTGPSRGVFIGSHVYAVSNVGVASAELDDVSTVLDEVFFEEDTQQPQCGWDVPWILPAVSEGLR